eukprot:3860122-Rhodomonas_salina.1
MPNCVIGPYPEYNCSQTLAILFPYRVPGITITCVLEFQRVVTLNADEFHQLAFSRQKMRAPAAGAGR